MRTFFITSIHDRYAAKPNEKYNMCLAKFAVSYDVVYCEEGNVHCVAQDDENDFLDEEINDENENVNNAKQEVIKLKNNLGFMRKRRESILRTNKVKLTTDPEKYYHALLMLYLPWWSEETLKGTYETYEEHYHNVKHIVDHNAQHFNHNSEHIDNAIDALIENGPP